jgi:hypothetical protein
MPSSRWTCCLLPAALPACLQDVLASSCYFCLVTVVLTSTKAWRSSQPPMPLQRTSLANSLLRAAVTLAQHGSRQPGGRRGKVLCEQLRAVDALLGTSPSSRPNRVGVSAFSQAVAVPGLAGSCSAAWPAWPRQAQSP